MRRIFGMLLVGVSISSSRPTFTGYSGAPGSSGTCASSCHGSGTGSMVLSGIQQSYDPLKTYTLTVSRTSGSSIYNFNASSRKGTSATVAGTFGTGSNTTLYSVPGVENGVRASLDLISTATFQWTAPAQGTGVVTLYLAGLQGSMSGQNTKITLSLTENVVSGIRHEYSANEFQLDQNFPNPFNPSTIIRYVLPTASLVKLSILDVLGKEIDVLVDREEAAGVKELSWTPHTSTGLFFCRIEVTSNEDGSRTVVTTRKMVMVK